jgi:hypothetical protein
MLTAPGPLPGVAAILKSPPPPPGGGGPCALVGLAKIPNTTARMIVPIGFMWDSF